MFDKLFGASCFGLVLLAANFSHAAEKMRVIAKSEWSKPVESQDSFLRARLLILEGRSPAYAGPGAEVLLYVELENATGAWGPPLRVYFEGAKALSFEVQDSDGKRVPPSPTFGSGGDVGTTWVTIPYDSRVRLRSNPGGWGTSGDAALVLPLRPHRGDYWRFAKDDEREYTLSGKITIAPPTDAKDIANRNDWRGTIEFPQVKFSPQRK